MSENNRFCMRKLLRNVAGIILHKFSAPGVAKITYFAVFWYLFICFTCFICIFIENYLFCSF